MIFARLIFLLAAALLVGCSTSSSLVDAVPVTSAQSSGPVAIVETGPPAKDQNHEITGIACQRMAWDPIPTNDAAVAKLIEKAQARGFNTVHSVKVGADVRSLAMNCWAAISATGVAFNDPARPMFPPARPVIAPQDTQRRDQR